MIILHTQKNALKFDKNKKNWILYFVVEFISKTIRDIRNLSTN
jgi:hypothetical protein